MSGWHELMEADMIALPVHRFEDALGWAEARAEHRRRKQRIRRCDVNGKACWDIRDYEGSVDMRAEGES